MIYTEWRCAERNICEVCEEINSLLSVSILSGIHKDFVMKIQINEIFTKV